MKKALFIICSLSLLSGCGVLKVGAQIAISPIGSAAKAIGAGIAANTPTQGSTYEYPMTK